MGNLVEELLGGLLPGRCPGCGRRGAPLCATCEAALVPAPGAPAPAPLEWWTACFAYEGVAREVVARAKYRGERVALLHLARRLAERAGATPVAFDVTPASLVTAIVTEAGIARPPYRRSLAAHVRRATRL